MKKLYVYADFDWLNKAIPVGVLSYESLRGNDSYGFRFDNDWLRKYGSLFISDDRRCWGLLTVVMLIPEMAISISLTSSPRAAVM